MEYILFMNLKNVSDNKINILESVDIAKCQVIKKILNQTGKQIC